MMLLITPALAGLARVTLPAATLTAPAAAGLALACLLGAVWFGIRLRRGEK